MQNRSLTTGLLLQFKEIDSPSILPLSDVVQSTEGGGEEEQDRGEGRGIISLSHAFIRSAQRPGQHHAVYISFKPTLTKP